MILRASKLRLLLLLITTAAAQAVPDLELMSKLKTLSQDPRLRLRHSGSSAACFVITIDIDGPGALAHIRVERDGAKSALLISSADGLPSGYSGEHAGFRIDGGAPGILLLTPRPAFGVVVGPAEDGKGMQFLFDLGKAQGGDTIDFDMGSVLSSILDNAQILTLDHETGEIVIETAHSHASLKRAADDAGFPIERMTLYDSEGAKITYIVTVLKGRPADSILGVTAEQLSALGMKSALKVEKTEGLKGAPFPSLDLWRDERTRVAGETLAKLFKPSAARTTDAVKALKAPAFAKARPKPDPRLTPELSAMLEQAAQAFERVNLVIGGMETVTDLKREQIRLKMDESQTNLDRAMFRWIDKGPSAALSGQMREAIDVRPMVLEMLNDDDGKVFIARWESSVKFEPLSTMVKPSELPLLWKGLQQSNVTPDQIKRFQAYLNQGEAELKLLQKDGVAGKVSADDRARRLKVIDDRQKKTIAEIFSAEQWQKFLTAMGSDFKGI